MGLGPPVCPDCYEREGIAKLLPYRDDDLRESTGLPPYGPCSCGYTIYDHEGEGRERRRRSLSAFEVPLGTTFERPDGSQFVSEKFKI